MPAVAGYPSFVLGLSGTSPDRDTQSIGMIWGLLDRGFLLGTGSQRIVIQEQRPEPALGRTVCDDTGLAPDYLLRKVRKLTGLTWEELSIALNVSKRSLHSWDAGQPLSQKHLAHLHRVAGLVERLAKGNPVHMRYLLLKDLGGQNALTFLREGQYELVERRFASEKAFPVFVELPFDEARKRRPVGVALANYNTSDDSAAVQGKPLKGIKPPKLRKG